MPSIISVSNSDCAVITPVSYWVVSTVHFELLHYKNVSSQLFSMEFFGF